MREIIAVTSANLAAIPARWGIAIVVIVGVAGVVAVLTSVMTMSAGLANAAVSNAREGWAIVVRDGAFAEVVSSIPRDQLVALETTPGIRTSSDGRALLELHYVNSVSQLRKESNIVGSVMVRGVDARSLQTTGFQLLEGRLFDAGKRELVVGALAAQTHHNLGVGDVITNKGVDWAIVGSFLANGSSLESELLGDLNSVMAGMHSTAFSSVRVRLEDGVTIDAFNERLQSDPRMKLEARWESDYFDSANTGGLIKYVAYVVSTIMAIGATFGALNVMFTAVSARTREIATLRALGFGPLPVAVSVLVEALVLALVGGAIGVVLAYLLYQGTTFTTDQLTSVSVVLQVTPELAVQGLIWGACIGILGGLFPAVAAVRMSVVDGLRSEA